MTNPKYTVEQIDKYISLLQEETMLVLDTIRINQENLQLHFIKADQEQLLWIQELYMMIEGQKTEI